MILTNCSPTGASKKGGAGGDENPFATGADDDDGTGAGISSAGAPIVGASFRYKYPNVPSKSGQLQYYITTFGSTLLGDGGIDPKYTQKVLSGNNPPEQIKIEPHTASNGDHFCFSNDQHAGGPECAPANDDGDSSVRAHIRQHQTNPTGRHPVFISALQFNFRHAPKSAGGFYSHVEFDGAYVEKAPIVIIKATGALAEVRDEHLMKISYGNSGTSCRIEQPNAVGFNPPVYMNREFYLSGLWTFERSGRSIFPHENSAGVVQDPHWCETEGVGEYLCGIFADRVSVWHSVLMPILYTSGGVAHRIYPNQVVRNRRVVNAPGAALTTYGRYSQPGDANLTYVRTPTGASPNAVIGQTDNSGNVIPNWEKYYIRKLCITGRRIDKKENGADEETPIINAMRVELRSPYIKRIR